MDTASPAACPKCGYQRKAADTAPAWQCPSCGIAYTGHDLLLGQGTADLAYFLRAADTKGKPAGAKERVATLRAAEQAMPRLRGFKNSVNQLDKNVGQLVFSGVSPWLARVSREAKPRELLVHLVKESQDEFDRFGKTLDQLGTSGEAALKLLQAIPPDTGK